MSDPAVDITQNGFKPVKNSGLNITEIDHLIDMNMSIRRELRDLLAIKENKAIVDTLLEMRFALAGKDRAFGPKIISLLFK